MSIWFNVTSLFFFFSKDLCYIFTFFLVVFFTSCEVCSIYIVQQILWCLLILWIKCILCQNFPFCKYISLALPRMKSHFQDIFYHNTITFQYLSLPLTTIAYFPGVSLIFHLMVGSLFFYFSIFFFTFTCSFHYDLLKLFKLYMFISIS